MAQTDGTQNGSSFQGISLESFLQMLEHERKSCTIDVQSEDVKGSFFFQEGELIDAECGQQRGIDAAYGLLALKDPVFKVSNAMDRMRRIEDPLPRILLTAASRSDEGNDEPKEKIMRNKPAGDAVVQKNPVLKQLISAITDIQGVKHYYLLNRQGKLITQSSLNKKVGDFIAYAIISGIQMRKHLDARGPHLIKMIMENGEVLLIIPGAGFIIGLLIESEVSTEEVTKEIRSVIAQLTRKKK